ncbi:U3 small nucleolar RNA-associated protein 4, partial [Phenoliferia sp. Uapishka_3]
MSIAPSIDTHDDAEMDVASPSTSTSAIPSKRRKAVPVHRCRFPDWSPSAISALTITPTTFDTGLLNFGGASAERGVLGVARANGDVELMCWGGHQGWVAWRTLPSSFPVFPSRSSKKPTSQLSHLLFTHQTTLSDSDLLLYDGDVEGAQAEIKRLEREGVRLFGVGGVGSELVEWEWGGPGSSKEVGRVKSTLPTLPPIFALAASRHSSHLAIGCEDSTIRILNILDDELELVSKIEVGGPGRVRALSLAWGPPESAVAKGKAREGSPSASSLPASFSTPAESYLIAGCSNSSIRRFDAPSSGSISGHWKSIHRMTVDQLKGEQTVVWAVVVLADGTVVSGDSMGNVKFFDGEMGTQVQSFRAHKADVLCLTVGSTGTSLFTSGVDQKTSEFRLVTVSSTRSSSGPSSRWIQASGRRLHSHDVRSLIVSPPYAFPISSPPATSTPIVPILTSAGLDLSLVIVPISPPAPPSSRPSPGTKSLKNPVSDAPSIEFETTVHRRAAYVPQRSKPFEVAREARLLVCRRDRTLGVWRVEEGKGGSGGGEGKSGWKRRQELFGLQGEEEEDVAPAKGWSKIIDMELKLQTNLVASAVSSDGKWLAVSDLFETKLFRLSAVRRLKFSVQLPTINASHLQKDGSLSPRRQKTFSTSLSAALPTSLGTGSSTLLFTADSSRLILATSFGSSLAVINLPAGKDEVFEVVKVFGDHAERGEGSREIRGRPMNGESNGVNGTNGAEHESEDEEMDGVREGSSKIEKPATVACVAVSSDGKWLASVDLERKVCVFDLETLQ